VERLVKVLFKFTFTSDKFKAGTVKKLAGRSPLRIQQQNNDFLLLQIFPLYNKWMVSKIYPEVYNMQIKM